MAKKLSIRTIQFKALKENDFIYYVSPYTQKVESLRVREVKGVQDKLVRGKHPTPEVYKHYIQITYYMRDLAVQSIDLHRIPTVTIIVDGRERMQLVSVKVDKMGDLMFPIPYSPNKEALEEYVNAGTTRGNHGGSIF